MGRGPEGIEAEVDAAVAAARKAFDGGDWSDLAPAARADIMDRFMAELAARGEPLAAAVSAQNGMPIALSSQLEAQFPLGVLQYYSGLARTMGARSEEHTSELQSLMRISSAVFCLNNKKI